MSLLQPEAPVKGEVDREVEVFAMDAAGLAAAHFRGGRLAPIDLHALEARRLRGKPVVNVIAGNDVARYWVQAPPEGARSLAELHQVAKARCAHLHGGAPGDWRMAADWRMDRPFVCAALPEKLVKDAEETLRAHGRVARWQSLWSVATQVMAVAFDPEGWNALRTPARTVLWHMRQGATDGMLSWPSSAEAPVDEAQQEARRQMNVACAWRGSAADGDLHWQDMANAASEASLALWLGGQRRGAS